MARLSQGILGGISGKIGNLVGSSWKGIAVIKTKALSVSNPRTASQVAQRARMSAVVAFGLQILASVIKPLNDRFAQGMSGFNLFCSRNIALFDDIVPTAPESFVMSSGKMVAIPITSVVADRSIGTAVVNYPTTLLDSYAQATDKIYCIVVDIESAGIVASSGTATRSAGTLSVNLPASWPALRNLQVYLAALRSDGTVASNTSYLAASIVA